MNETASKNPAESANGDWVRLPKKGETLRGLSRGVLYRLFENGAIESITIKGPPRKIRGKKERADSPTRGVRLIYLPSLDAFLQAQRTKPEAASAQ